MWRVAVYDQTGALGPWSEPRKFRVASYRDLALEGDLEPPPIEVELLLNGNIALVKGTTEPGARLQLNGEDLFVAADGTFSTSVVLYGSGKTPVVFKAVDRAGNSTVERRVVYLDES